MGKPIKGGYQIIKLNTVFNLSNTITNITDEEDLKVLQALLQSLKDGEEIKPIYLKGYDGYNTNVFSAYPVITTSIDSGVSISLFIHDNGRDITIDINDNVIAYTYTEIL